MTLRERILSVYRGETPDAVPYMLDLSHWFYHREHRPWDLSQAYETPETELIECHRRLGAGFYMPNLASFYSAAYPDDVRARTWKEFRDGCLSASIGQPWRLTASSAPSGRKGRRSFAGSGSPSLSRPKGTVPWR